MNEIHTFDQIGADDVGIVGGKGLSLGLMARGGLPVPAGFCITTAAHRRLRGKALHEDAVLADAIRQAYRLLGSGAVAVRSSATSEDGAETSFAGQQETILGVNGESELLDAIARCWDSLHSERAIAYRRQQKIDDDGLAMAVVVQRLVPADVAGVLFTRDPLDPEGKQMLVEASWGLGETVVSGQVTPDRFHVDRTTATVKDRHISTKTLRRTAAGPEPVPPPMQNQACLDDAQLAELAELGRRVEQFYGEARDVEWALEGSRFWLLQARPITTADAAERELVKREEVAALRTLAEHGGTVWSRYNLSEILPEPTPMTWAIVRRFMSGRGGFGLMYRDLGFKPQRSLDEIGVYDLICGRPYCNLSREPRLYSGWLPYEHPFELLKKDPTRALYPQAVQNPRKAGALFWLFLPFRLPIIMVKSIAFAVRLGRTSKTFAERFRKDILPPFLADAEREAQEDHSALPPAALLERLEFWIHRTLYDFARDSLKPTALAAIAMGNVERWLRKVLGPDGARDAVGQLSLGIRPDADADFASGIRDLAAGRLDHATFLTRFGHRGPQEMELAQPRWAEDPSGLDRLLAQMKGTPAEDHVVDLKQRWEKFAADNQLSAFRRAALEPEVNALHTYLSLRETAKHWFMRGYGLIRRLLLELDGRFNLQGNIFFLTPDELPRLAAGENLAGVIAERKRRRSVVLSLFVPPVLFSDDLEAVDRQVVIEGADVFKGIPLSAGVAEAPALVLERPNVEHLPAEPYVLVCPSTDPSWVPLFVQAKGLVMETGGVLSHGAIVAREFGLPGVAGIPGVVQRIKTGQRLCVDGARGTVTVLP